MALSKQIRSIIIETDLDWGDLVQIAVFIISRGNCCLFVVTPPLPRDGGTARTAIQVHAVNLIEIGLGERWQPISNQS